MATTQTLQVKIDAAINAEPTIKALKELKNLQREVVSGSEEFNKIQARINDIADATKTARSQSEDWIDTLASLPGPLGAVGRGLDTFTSSTNKLGLAFKSLGIGLIVSAVGALTAAFSQNEKMTKKLEPLMIGLQKILGGIFSALEPLIDAFINLGLKALPFVIDGVGKFYSALVGLFSFLKNTAIGVAKILKGINTLDINALQEGWDILTNGWDVAVQSFKSNMDRYKAGTTELTATEKKNAETRTTIAKKESDDRKKIIDDLNAYVEKGKEARGKTEQEELDAAKKVFDELVKRARRYGLDTSKIEEAYQIQRSKIQKTYADKRIEEEQKEFTARLKAQNDLNKLLLDAQKANLDEAKVLYGENSNEARMAQDKIFEIQKKTLEDEKSLLQGKQQLSQEETNRLAQIAIEQQNLTTAIEAENKKREQIEIDTALKLAENEKRSRDQRFADRMQAAGFDLELQQKILDDKIAQDNAYYEKLLANEKISAEQRKKLEEEYTSVKRANAEAQISIEQKKFDAQQKLLGALASAISTVSDLIGRDTVAGKALAVAASLVNTYSAIAGQLKAFAGVPIPGFAIAQAIATGLVGFKAVADIVKTPIPGKGSSGAASTPAAASTGTAVPRPRGLFSGGMVSGPGSGRSDLIPAMLSNGESVINAQSTALFKPLLSSINAIGGGKRFADGGLAVGSFSQDQAMKDLQSALSMQQAPIKTYVVSSDMTSSQMLDRNIKSRSTL